MFRFLQKDHRKEWCLKIVAILSLAVFTAACMHQALDLQMVMWLEPRSSEATFFAPLINGNHLSRLFGLFVFLNLFANSVTASKTWQTVYQIAAATSCVGVLAANSRAGTALLVIGLAYCVFHWLMRAQTKKHNATAKRKNPVRVITATFILLAALLGLSIIGDGFLSEYQATLTPETEELKWGGWLLAFDFIRDYSLWGAGLNGLSGGVSPYFSLESNHLVAWGQKRVYYAENIFLDLFAAFGLLGGSCLLFMWARVILTRRDQLLTSPYLFAGLIFILGAELFDYALVTPCILWLTLLAYLLMIAPKKPSRKTSWRTLVTIWIISAPIIFYTATLANTADRKQLDQQLNRGDNISLERLVKIQTNIPFDANLSFAIAARYRVKGDFQKALKWSNYAMLLWPTLHGAHFEAARALYFLQKREQAMLEYKLALKVNPLLIENIVDDFKN